ncbi:MAG: hypothetical protein CM15mV9_0860 [uncultured marine virus]|nr:MAG: hypothetical protein CM15mV9_0860 [uncultured marine virus]
MANRTLILASESSVASGVGNSTTVGSATCVRVFNSSGSDLVLTVTDPTGEMNILEQDQLHCLIMQLNILKNNHHIQFMDQVLSKQQK